MSGHEWFVYDNTTYYPSAEIVQAATAEDAARIACWGNDKGEGVVVFPVDSVAYANAADHDVLEGLRAEGRRSSSSCA